MANFSLLPKNDAYFEDFDIISGFVCQIANAMYEGVNAELIPAELQAHIQKLESAADEVVSRCLSRLDTSFVTPIEREDIHMLIVTIDDVGDMLEAATNRLAIYEITVADDALRAMLAKIVEMSNNIQEAVAKLRTLKPEVVHAHTRRIRELEDEIDVIHRDAQRTLFARRPEAYDLVRWKEVYDYVEDAADCGRLVARTVDHILLRHS